MANLQGDIIAIVNTSNAAVVEYVYDAWGNVLSISGTMATTLGTLNPLTYRGYVYDYETNLYYLQSRYYSPEWGRFLNADALVATGQGLLGNNMFAYCRNNPVCRVDISGTEDMTALDIKNDDEMDIPGDEAVGKGGDKASGYNYSGSSAEIVQGGGSSPGGGNGGNSGNFNFKSESALIDHFNKHKSDFGDVFGTPQEYVDTANYVIQNGEYVANQNAYVKFYGMNGHANFAFVGMSRDHSYITTFHLRHVSQIQF